MVRLLFLSDRFPPDIGGVARSSGRIVAILSALGVEVDVVVWSRSLAPGEVRQDVYPCGNQTLPCYRIGQYRHWDMTLLNSMNVLDWLRDRHSYQAIWGHYLFPAGFVAVWFGRLHGIISIVSARGNDLEREMFPPGDFARLQWTLTQASVVTAVSQDMAHKISHLVPGRSSTPIQVLPNGVDGDQFRPDALTGDDRAALRSSLGIAAGELVLGFSGELREKKGRDFLLNALTTVRQQQPACLLIIGEVRSDQAVTLLRYRTEHPDDGDRIIITGHWPDPKQVAQHLCLCDLYLQPSLWDGMPNALLEAMATGLGCIASDAGGIPEIITHGKTGFILPRWHLHHLGKAVLEWVGLDQSSQQQIRQQARQAIVQDFSLEQEHQRLEQLMQSLDDIAHRF